MVIRISIHPEGLAARQRGLKQWKVAASVKDEISRFLNELELGRVNRGKRISERRRLKYLDMLKTPLEFMNKPTSRLKLADIERFEKALASDRIRSKHNNMPLA